MRRESLKIGKVYIIRWGAARKVDLNSMFSFVFLPAAFLSLLKTQLAER